MNCKHTGKFFYHNCPDDAPAAGAGVHALVIGTSDYTARGEAKAVFANLPGTAVAAGRFATWLKGFHDPRGIPLRTIRLLLAKMPPDPIRGIGSEDGHVPADNTWDDATYPNVALALQRWRNDCNSHSGNVAILYVGGHGTVTTDGAQHIFLSEANVYEDRYLSSMNVTVIKDLMMFCRAQSNIYIFDSCALTGGQVPDITEAGGLRIAPFTDKQGGGKRKYELTITAARVGTASHTLGAGDGTLLSWALLKKKLLETAGALMGGFFTVTKEKLHEKLLPTMGEWPDIKLPEGHEPVVKGDAPEGITRPEPPPDFTVSLVSDPEAAGNIVTVTISDKTSGETKKQCQVNGGEPTPFELPAGRYKAVAEYRTDSRTREKEFSLDLDQSLRIFAFTGEAVQ